LECDLGKVIASFDSENHSWAIAGSNAGAAYTSFWNDATKLNELDWANIPARLWRESAVKEAKQAEFLVYKSFSWTLVDRVGVQNLATYNAAVNAVSKASHKPQVAIEANWYY
jgi:hypothetical protein